MTTPDNNGNDRHRDLRSYGRRHGRKLSARQERLRTQLLPELAVDTAQMAPSTPSDMFGDRCDEMWLEIGFGGGEHLIAQAKRHPNVGFIGCEPYLDGVVKALAAIEDEKLDNIRLYDDDARDVLRWLPEGSIACAFILFPDPWPKRRHVKRRLINPHTLQLLAGVMRKGGVLRIATDIGDYARTILIAMQKSPEFSWTARRAGDWRLRPHDWPATRYEAKAGSEGRRSYYLTFTRSQS